MFFYQNKLRRIFNPLLKYLDVEDLCNQIFWLKDWTMILLFQPNF
jgi:hypothetical protein